MPFFDTISLGSATLDIFLKSSQFQVVPGHEGEQAALCQPYGGKIDVEQFFMQSGGGATNTAVAFARTGLHAAVVAEMGDDLASHAVLQELEQEHVDTQLLVQEKDEQTAVSALLIAAEGDRTAITARGAAKLLTVDDIRWSELQANWIHISSLGNNELILALAKHCHQHHIPFSWNPGGAELAAMKSGSLHPSEVFPTLFCLNAEESDVLVQAGYEVSECGENVIVTDGGKGGRFFWKGEWRHYQPALNPTVVQLTGAGDAFAAGTIVGLLHEKPLPQAIEWGVQNAASVIGHMGAKTGLLRTFSQ